MTNNIKSVLQCSFTGPVVCESVFITFLLSLCAGCVTEDRSCEYAGLTADGALEIRCGSELLVLSNGVDGQNGTSCSYQGTNEDERHVVECGDAEFILSDGQDGSDGSDGEDGTSCQYSGTNDEGEHQIECGEDVFALRDGRDGRDGQSCWYGGESVLGHEIRCGHESFVLQAGNDGEDGQDGRDGEDGQDDFTTTLENVRILNESVDENTVVLNCAATLRTNDQNISNRQIVAEIFVNGEQYPYREYVGDPRYPSELGDRVFDFDQVFHSLDLFVGTVRAGDRVACRTTVYASRRGRGGVEPVGVTATAISEEVEVLPVDTARIRGGFLAVEPFRETRSHQGEYCIGLRISVDGEYDAEGTPRCMVETRWGSGTTVTWSPVLSAIEFVDAQPYEQMFYCGPLGREDEDRVAYEVRAACIGEPAMEASGTFRWDVATVIAEPPPIAVSGLQIR
jgi:hypothetical protein